MEIKVADALIQCLEKENVEVIFGYPGGAMLPIYDSLYHSKMKHVLVRHEQGAVHAADGYARVTGKVGVCMATSGPGATNLVTGIANAYMDSIPLVIFTGQVSTNQIGTDAFQEVDITGITIPITKHNYLLKDPLKLPAVVKNAFHIAATGRPGPVLIDIPRDVAQMMIPQFKYPTTVRLRGYKPTYKGHPSKIKEIAALIKKAKRPVIYAGGGILAANASEELLQFAEAISGPVTNTFMGLAGFPGEHPLFLGMLGLHGTRSANLAISECDLLIGLGARFDDRVVGNINKFAQQATVIHVDIDPAEIGKVIATNVPLVGDVKSILKSLLPLLEHVDRSQWLERIQGFKQQHPLTYIREGTLKPQFVIEQLWNCTKGEAIVVTDVGQHQMWVAQYYLFKHPRTLVSSGGLGTMGFGLPASLGACIGAPGKQVILVTGDGSIQMTIQELGTMMEQGLAVKIIILNNYALGMVRQLQEFYCEGRYMSVNFTFHPDFEVLAKAYGIEGYTFRTEEDVLKRLPEALAKPGPAIINCIVPAEENVSPMVMAGQGIHEAIDCG